MKTPTRLTIGFGLAGCAAVLIMAMRPDTPPSRAAAQKRPPAVMPSAVRNPLTADSRLQLQPGDEEPLLPPPVIASPPPAGAVLPAVNAPNIRLTVRPPEESMLSSWAARDPEGAGRWLNQNRSHPKFADMVRGYAIQIATIDPAAARQWAALIPAGQSRFGLGGTLEQHIDAIETMLKSPAEPQTAATPEASPAVFLPDYLPRLVRQRPGEEPVFEMEPVNPLL